MENKPIYTIDPLFDFQALCDTDLGLYKLIKRDYYDRNVFDNILFDSTNINFVKTMILTRQKFNPLSIFCKKGIMKDNELDELYKQFLDEEYDNILSLSSPTAIMNIAAVSNSVNKIVNVTVLCKTQKEADWIHKYTYKLDCIVSDYDNFDLSKYDTVYIKDLYTLLSFNQDSINKKNIIFSNFFFNLENGSSKFTIPIVEVSKKYYKRNKFMTAEPYKDIYAPMGEMV